jgi:zinc protease
VSTAVQSEVTDAAAREVMNEIERMRAERISDDELSLATSYLDGVFPIRYETTAAIAAALGTLVVYDLPDDWYDEYRERVRSVTTEHVLTAAQRHLHPESLQMVVVGNASSIRDRLTGLGFGALHVYDAEGRPIPT